MESGELLAGRYRLAAPLGHGGTAVVWRARDETLGREVAVKLLDARLADDEALVGRLRAEARAAARLHHPNVVVVYDVGDTPRPDGPPIPYVVLELVQGHSLSDVLGHGALRWRDAVRICAQVAAGLAAAHAHGIVHRDVKPENVMLTTGGAKLLDFGISATIGELDTGPDGELLCTPAYVAPERLEAGPVRAACDMYGLGLVLYKALTGELPWRPEPVGVTELVAAHRRDAPAPLPPIPGLSDQVADLCMRCLAKQPGKRPASAEVERVLAAAAGTPASASYTRAWRPVIGQTTAPTAVERLDSGGWPASRRQRALALAAAAVVIGGVLFGFRALVPDAAPAGQFAGAAAAPVACEVRYDVRQDSGNDFAAGVTLTNTGVAPVTGWRLDFAFPSDQRVVSSSAGTWRQTGPSVVVEGTGDTGTLAAGRSVVLDFEASYQEENPLPTAFRLNGTECPHVLTAAADRPVPDQAGGAPATAGDDDGNRGDGNRGDGNRGHGNGDDDDDDNEGEGEGDDD
jgi:eukaryotic-like serine/threonine-protein kinase